MYNIGHMSISENGPHRPLETSDPRLKIVRGVKTTFEAHAQHNIFKEAIRMRIPETLEELMAINPTLEISGAEEGQGFIDAGSTVALSLFLGFRSVLGKGADHSLLIYATQRSSSLKLRCSEEKNGTQNLVSRKEIGLHSTPDEAKDIMIDCLSEANFFGKNRA